MASAQAPLRAELQATAWAAPEPLFYSASSLCFERDGFVDLLSRQLVAPVRFTQAVNALYGAGYDSFLEVGPGAVLSGLVRRIAPQAAWLRCRVWTVSPPFGGRALSGGRRPRPRQARR